MPPSNCEGIRKMRFLSKFSHSSLSLVERMGQYQPGGPRVSVASRRSSSKWRSISRISWRSAKLSDIDPVLKTHGQSKGIFKLFHTFRKQATQKFLYYENPRCKAVCSSRLLQEHARTACSFASIHKRALEKSTYEKTAQTSRKQQLSVLVQFGFTLATCLWEMTWTIC